MYKITKIHVDSLEMIFILVGVIYFLIQGIVVLITGQESMNVFGSEIATVAGATYVENLSFIASVLFFAFIGSGTTGLAIAVLINFFLKLSGGFKFEMKKAD